MHHVPYSVTPHGAGNVGDELVSSSPHCAPETDSQGPGRFALRDNPVDVHVPDGPQSICGSTGLVYCKQCGYLLASDARGTTAKALEPCTPVRVELRSQNSATQNGSGTVNHGSTRSQPTDAPETASHGPERLCVAAPHPHPTPSGQRLAQMILCDRHFQYGDCPRRSAAARTPEDARRLADQDGWLLGRERDLCPDCCGSNRHRAVTR